MDTVTEITRAAITTAATKGRVTITPTQATTQNIMAVITRPVSLPDRTPALPVLATCTKPKTGVLFS